MSKEKSAKVSEQELKARLMVTLEKVLKSQAKKNIPLVYKNEYCIQENQFVHEYSNGTKYLIQQDQRNSAEEILHKF